MTNEIPIYTEHALPDSLNNCYAMITGNNKMSVRTVFQPSTVEQVSKGQGYLLQTIAPADCTCKFCWMSVAAEVLYMSNIDISEDTEWLECNDIVDPPGEFDAVAGHDRYEKHMLIEELVCYIEDSLFQRGYRIPTRDSLHAVAETLINICEDSEKGSSISLQDLLKFD